MAAESSWSLRGVDPRARAIARTAAKREGITIGEWLNRQLLEDGEASGAGGGDLAGGGSYDDPEALAHVLDRLSRRIEAAEHRSTLAITGIDQSVLSIISRLQGAEELQTEFAERYSAALDELRDTQKALHARIERMQRDGGDAGGIEALKSLEEALAKVANQVYDSEAETKAKLESLRAEIERAAKRSGERIETVSRALDERLADVERKVEVDFTGASALVAKQVDAAARKLKTELEETARREVDSRIAERAEAGSAQAKALEMAVAEVTSRLGLAERDTDRAIKALERSFAELDARVRRAETRSGAASDGAFASEMEQRFEGLSRELADMVASSRAEIAAKVVEIARREGPAALEAEFKALGRQVADVEAKQRKTLERITQEVAKLAGAVEARVRKSEAASESRIAEVASSLAAAQETTPAQAKEIGRLHARLKEVEARAAAAADAVARRIDAVDERLAQHDGGGGEDLARRLRESEQRTRSMIDGALSDINRRLDHADDQTASVLSPVQRSLDGLRMRLEALEGGRAPQIKAAAAAFEAERDPLDFSEPDAFADTPSFELDGGDGAFEIEPQPALIAKSMVRAQSADADEAADPFVDLDAELRALEAGGEISLDIEELVSEEGAIPSSQGPRKAPIADFSQGEEDGPAFDLVYGGSQDEDGAASEGDPIAGGEINLDPFADDAPERAPPSDFLRAAREAARQASAGKAIQDDERVSPGFGPVAAPAVKSKKGRSLLFAAGGLAFLAVGAAGVIVLRDSSGSGEIGPTAPELPLDGLFATRPPGSDVAALESQYVGEPSAAADEPTLPIDLTSFAGADFALYAEGDDLYAPIRPDAPAAGADLDALLAGAGVGGPSPAEPPVAPEPVLAAPEPAAPEPASAGTAAELAAAAPPREAMPAADESTVELAAPAVPDVIAPVTTLEEAAGQGDPVAQFELGSAMIERGELGEGVRLIEAAADSGLAAARYRLGKLYETGRGVGADVSRARGLFQLAAEQGHRNAMHSLGILYAEGRGVTQDFEEAARWFEEAALLGATDAQFNLAVLYQEGLGVPISLSDAYAWFAIAGRAGDEEAEARAETLAGRLEPQVRARAEDAARRFSPRPLDETANGVFNDTPWTAAGARSAASPGSQLARVQTALTRLGYAPGPADGVPGAMTAAAIRAYQIDNGLAPTGEADAALLETLEAEVGRL